MRDYFKAFHGKSKAEWKKKNRIPKAKESLDRMFLRTETKYPIRLLGVSDDGEVTITEEERYVNYHVLGAPGEGKSKFLEYEVRQDIDNNLNPKVGFANSICFIDGSEKGDTVRNVLNYCAQVNYKKVLLIDPTLSQKYGRIPCIAPLNPKIINKSVENIMEALAILFESNYKNQRRIRRNLSALLRLLTRRNLTLYESIYFSVFSLDADKRAAILGDDRDSWIIKELVRSETKFEKMESTVNIMDVFWQEPLRSILCNKTGISFINAVKDGWIILVNLSPYMLSTEQSQLLGIILLNLILQAIDYWVNKDWKNKFYLYIDEAGYFATNQLADMLTRKRKSGIRMYLAHQDYSQFGDKPKVLSAVEGDARIKLMFNVPDPKDRLRMVNSLGYGGNIPPALASYTNADLPKQHAVIKKNKSKPVRIMIPYVKPVPPAPEEYIKKILSQSFYKDARSIPANSKSAQSGKVDDAKTTGKAHVPGRVPKGVEKTVRPDNKKPPEPPPKRPIKI